MAYLDRSYMEIDGQRRQMRKVEITANTVSYGNLVVANYDAPIQDIDYVALGYKPVPTSWIDQQRLTQTLRRVSETYEGVQQEWDFIDSMDKFVIQWRVGEQVYLMHRGNGDIYAVKHNLGRSMRDVQLHDRIESHVASGLRGAEHDDAAVSHLVMEYMAPKSRRQNRADNVALGDRVVPHNVLGKVRYEYSERDAAAVAAFYGLRSYSLGQYDSDGYDRRDDQRVFFQIYVNKTIMAIHEASKKGRGRKSSFTVSLKQVLANKYRGYHIMRGAQPEPRADAFPALTDLLRRVCGRCWTNTDVAFEGGRWVVRTNDLSGVGGACDK